jgi:hypothetical protein
MSSRHHFIIFISSIRCRSSCCTAIPYRENKTILHNDLGPITAYSEASASPTRAHNRVLLVHIKPRKKEDRVIPRLKVPIAVHTASQSPIITTQSICKY